MDGDILFLVAMAAFYILQQVLSKKKKGQSPEPLPEKASVPESGNDLSEALEEIRKMFGMEAAEPEPEPIPQSAARPPSKPAALPIQKRRTESEFHDFATSEPTASELFEHGRPDPADPRFVRRQTLETTPESESLFSLTGDQFHSPVNPMARDVFRDPLIGHHHDSMPETPSVIKKVRRRLQSEEAVREAFVLKEILGPPRCRTGPHRVD